MHSFAQSLVLFALSLPTLFVHAHVILPYHNAFGAEDCQKAAVVTVTATVTAPGYGGYAASVETSLQPDSRPTSPPYKSNSILEHVSCFDRKHHAFTYSYHHGGYHFSHMPSSHTTGYPKPYPPQPRKASSAGPADTSAKPSSTP